MFEIYTNVGCNKCTEVIDLLKSYGQDFREYQINRDINISEVKQRFPKVNFLPIILKDDLRITGIDELRETLEQTNIIRFDSKLQRS